MSLIQLILDVALFDILLQVPEQSCVHAFGNNIASLDNADWPCIRHRLCFVVTHSAI